VNVFLFFSPARKGKLGLGVWDRVGSRAMEYDDLVLIEKSHDLQKALEIYAEVSEATSTRAPTTLEKYVYLCTLQGHEPSKAYVALLQEDEALSRSHAATFRAVTVESSLEDGAYTEGTLSYSDSSHVPTPSHRGTVLALSREQVGTVALLPIILTLHECQFLRSVQLQRQGMTSAHVELLCRALLRAPALESVDVSYNPCGSRGLTALLHTVLRRPNITQCEVRGLQVIAPLLRRLETAVARNQTASLSR